MKKVLYGLIGNKIAVIDADTSEKAKKQCFKEKCTSIIVADRDQALIDKFIDEEDVSVEMFTGVVL